MVTNPWIRRKVLIVVRTYPNPAKKGVEVSCTAAITESGEWLRLFPIPYRFLTFDRRFKKYQWVEVDMKRSSDSRPESYRVNTDSIQILSDPLPATNKWKARKDILFPLQAHCLCCLEKEREQNGRPTLGFFKPGEITKFTIKPEDNPDWTPNELQKLSQYSLFENSPSQPLEKIPYKFYYSFRCDEASCRGHTLSCTDWELGESYRKWRSTYGSAWESAIRTTYEHKMMKEKDTHFFVGTMRSHPNRWIIVGLFYPKK